MIEDLDTAPGWLTLTAGTMALMSACAHPRPDLPPAEAQRLRHLMAQKLLGSLGALRAHPLAPAPLREVAGRMQGHWQTLLSLPLERALDPAGHFGASVHAAPPQRH
jgi:hypothetical protein